MTMIVLFFVVGHPEANGATLYMPSAQMCVCARARCVDVS